MTSVETTRLSSKGQVVIPEGIRQRLGLRTGMHFVVVGQGETILLKAVKPPSMADFADLVREARGKARRAGLRRRDIASAVRKVRRGRDR